MDYENMENRNVYYLYEKIKIESQTGYNMFNLYNFFGQFITNGINIFVSLLLIFPLFVNNTAPLFTRLIMGLSILLTALIIYYCNKKNNAINMNMFDEFVPHNALFNFYGYFFSNYNAGKDIRLYAMEKMLEEEQLSQNNISNKILVTARKKMLKYVLSGSVLKDILVVGVYLFVLALCLNESILLGDIAKYVACITMLIVSFTDILTNIQTLFENNKYLKRYFEFLDLPRKAAGKNMLPVNLTGPHEFRLENVYFKYPYSETYVLKNVSMVIKSGSRVAIVGENGSGKTTLIKLLCRLYDVEEGSILFDGVNIKEYDKDSYMKILNVVFQDFTLFSFPLGQNIAISEHYDTEKVIKAIDKAGLSPRFEDMKNGLETVLYKDFDDMGVEISGGEAQKIAIARAFYKDSDILFLDEPTASLDPIAESEIYEKINQISHNALIIFVSHRLSSCKFCDEIMVLHNGELIQNGTHTELLSDSSGKYYELWNAQAQFYK
ncbi:MAG: ABC transporter ATP-binding protein/permease [Prevotellaceae bacterium]|nr:ABC transporter ATP-binding protein/permease [Prevotellaceae bacterium]